MNDMFDLPTGRLDPDTFNLVSRCVKQHLTDWPERFRWSRIILNCLPGDEQDEIRAWTSRLAVSLNDEAMLILILFFNAALRSVRYRTGHSRSCLIDTLNRVQSAKTARGTMLPLKTP